MTLSRDEKHVNCTIESCPRGCTVVTLGPTCVHLSGEDFVSLVKLMLHHAWRSGLEVPVEASQVPLPQLH